MIVDSQGRADLKKKVQGKKNKQYQKKKIEEMENEF